MLINKLIAKFYRYGCNVRFLEIKHNPAKFLTRFFYLFLCAFMVAIASAVFAAGKQTSGSGAWLPIKAVSSVTQLYYNVTLNPLSSGAVLSPVDGSIVNMFFDYGGEITKGQVLFSLSSDKLASDYRDAVQSYLQKKQQLAKDKQEANTDLVLYHAGATSRVQYEGSQTTYENSQLSFVQAQEKLRKVLSAVGLDAGSVEQLTLADTSKVTKVLDRRFSQIKVVAPTSGIALFPADTGGGDSNAGQLKVGSTIKKSQLLLSIGNLRGLSATLNVSEINRDRVRVGQVVFASGDAFPGEILKGFVSSVAEQAESNQSGYGSGSLSMFAVKVTIPKITPQQAKIIHVGMSARIRMPVINPAQISLPFAAVNTQGSVDTVIVKQTDGSIKTVPVITGETTVGGRVTILRGLQAGQEVWNNIKTPPPQTLLPIKK